MNGPGSGDPDERRPGDPDERRPEAPDGIPAHMPIEDLGPEAERRLKGRAIEEAPVGITISDPARDDNPLIFLNDAFESLTGYPKHEVVGRNCRFLQGEDTDPAAVAALREAIDRAEPVSVELRNYRKDGEPFWNRVDVAPVRDDDGTVTNYVGFQTDITARKEAELAVERERERLEHLLDRVAGLLGDVHGDLIRATSRGDVEAAICDRIAAADPFAFCWVGRPDRPRDAVEATVWAGEPSPPDGALRVDRGDATPTAALVSAAMESGRVRVLDDPGEVAALVDRSPWLAGAGVAGVAAIPLAYRETRYGVAVVYSTEAGALDAHERVVLEALGRAAATAINALERERAITADQVVELEFEVRDPGLFPVDLSARYGATLEYEGSVHPADDAMRLFFTTDLDPAAIEPAIRGYDEVASVSTIATFDDGNVLEFTTDGDSIVGALAGRGAVLRSLVVRDGTGSLTVQVPIEANVRDVVDRLRERYPATELVARRDRERPPETRREFVETLEASLTGRQLVALQTAYVGGYYDWDRGTTGDDLAASMGIARSTFHQHLRAAERKLVAAVFEPEGIPN